MVLRFTRMFRGRQVALSALCILSLTAQAVPASAASPSADVSVTIDGDEAMAPGDFAQYEVVVANNGPATATRTSTRITVPRGLWFDPDMSSDFCEARGLRSVYCYTDSLLPGDEEYFDLSFEIDPNAVCDARSVVSARTTARPRDNNRRNNSASAILTIDCDDAPLTGVDLGIEMSGPATVDRLGTLTYQFVVRNTGTVGSSAPQLLYAVPSSLAFTGASGASQCGQSGNFVICTGFTVPAGSSRTTSLSFSPKNAACSSVIATQGKVVAETVDVNPSNNVSNTLTTKVTCTTSQSLMVKPAWPAVIGDTVPRASTVRMLSVALSAPCTQSASVHSLTVFEKGSGDVNGIQGVYASVNGQRVSPVAKVSPQTQRADLQLSPLVVNACETITLDLMMILGTAQQAQEYALYLDKSTNVSASIPTTGAFPIAGPAFRTANVTPGYVKLGYEPVYQASVRQGDRQAVVGKVVVRAPSGEDQTLYSLILKNDGSAQDMDLGNLALRREYGATVGTKTVASLTNGRVLFTFDPPFTVAAGDSAVFDVLADIRGGNGRTMQFKMEQNADLFAVSSLYGYGVNGQLYGSPALIDIYTSPTLVVIGTPLSQTDMGIVLNATGTLAPGKTSSLFFTLSNDGLAAATNVKATILLPAGVSYSTARVSRFCVANGSIITCSFSSLAPNATLGSSIDIIANANLCSFPSPLKFIGTVSANQADANPSNNTSIVSVGSACTPASGSGADLGIKITGPSVIRPTDDKPSYDITVANNGPSAVKEFTFTTILPTDFKNVSFHWLWDMDCSLRGQTITCKSTKPLAPGKTMSMDLQMIVPQTACGLSPSVQTAIAASSVPDPVLSNNSASQTTTVSCDAEVRAKLAIVQKSTGSSDVAVRGQKNATLLRFDAHADNGDVVLRGTTFSAAVGNLAGAANYTLWTDTTSDGVVDTILLSGKAPSGATITFDQGTKSNNGFVIPQGKTAAFEVHADIASSGGGNELQLQFATAQPAYVQAENLQSGKSLGGIQTNGACAGACDIAVTTAPAIRLVIVNQGNLYVTKSPTMLRNRQLLGGTLGDPILRLQFRAEYEDIDVTDLQFSSPTPIHSIDRLELYREGSTVPFATATVGACGSDTAPANTLCAQMDGRQLVVPKRQTADVLVRPRMKTDENGAVSGDVISFDIAEKAVANTVTGEGAVRGRGVLSSNVLGANNGNTASEGEIFIGTGTAGTNQRIVGQRNLTVLSKIVSVTNANPDGSMGTLPTGQADTPIGVFKLSAAPNANTRNGLNKAELRDIIFNVASQNVEFDATRFRLQNKANPTQTAACTAKTADGVAMIGIISGSFLVECQAAGLDARIDPGADLPLVLQSFMTNTRVTVAASSLQVSLQNFSGIDFASFGPFGSHLRWIDSDNGASPTFLWIEYPESVIKSTLYSN